MQFKVNNKSFDGFCLVDMNGNPVNETNPIITTSSPGTTALALVLTQHSVFLSHGIAVVPGGVGKSSRLQLFNPIGSGKTLVVYNINTWHATGTVQYQVGLLNQELSAAENTSAAKQNVYCGSDVSAVAQFREKTDAATLLTDILSRSSHASTAPNGTSIFPALQPVIGEGCGLVIEAITQNVGFNTLLVWGEISNNN